MKWIEINKKELPKTEVLVANFKPKTYGYSEKIIGYIYIENGIIICENEHEQLEGCTHYININQFDIKP